MARSAATVVENNFIKGLITEATGLNYPENSCTVTWDCEFDFFGRVARRLAIDLEFGSVSSAIAKAGNAINIYHWKNVTGDGLIQLVVVQIGSTLYFYNTTNPSILSTGLLASTVSLTGFSPVGAPAPSLYDCQFADGLNKLFVFHPYLNNFYVSYNQGANTVSATGYSLDVRDTEGDVADPQTLANRPTTTLAGMNQNHLYNLYNQGWPQDNIYLSTWDAARTDMPGNCDVWWNFKNSSDAFDTATIANSGRGNSPAPKGFFVWNAYNINRASLLGSATVTSSGTARSSTGVFFAGRVFYAGINASGYTSKVYYSQIIERSTQVGQCYQINDPTSEDLFDLLPADGGVISIPEAGQIYKLFAMANGLLVFGYRGIWFITGSSGIGFTATDFTVNKISSIRTVSATSFVDVNGMPMWWNTDGIFSVVQGDNAPTVQSMSIQSIQSFFDEIPNGSKLTARGYFNPVAQVVQWVFRTTEPGNIDERYDYDAVLNYNVLTSAFFPWTIPTGGPSIHGLVVVDGTGGTISEQLVVDNTATQVVDNLGNNVGAYQLSARGVVPKAKFLTSYTAGSNVFSWSEFLNSGYYDWPTLGLNINYTSYFVTGYKIHGNATMKFAPMYVTVYNEGVGQAYIQGVWDFAASSSTGRYSTKQYMNFNDENFTNQSKRVKVRGQGKALQFYVSSLPGQPFNMSGWSSFETGNTQP